MKKIYAKIFLIGYAVASVAHALGLFLLYKAKADLPNQRIVTMNLAAAEMMLCLWTVCAYAVKLILGVFFPDKTLHYMTCFFEIFLYTNIRFVLIHIIIDRFLYVWLHLKYSIYINKRSLPKIIVCYWLGSSLLGVLFTLLVRFQVIDMHMYFHAFLNLILALDVLIVTLAIITYVYLFSKVRKLSRSPSARSRKVTVNEVAGVWRKLKIPTLMVLSFVIFNFSVTIIQTIMTKNHTPALLQDLYNTASFLDMFGWLSDAVIYIFLQKPVRDMLLSWCKRTEEVEVPLQMNEV